MGRFSHVGVIFFGQFPEFIPDHFNIRRSGQAQSLETFFKFTVMRQDLPRPVQKRFGCFFIQRIKVLGIHVKIFLGKLVQLALSDFIPMKIAVTGFPQAFSIAELSGLWKIKPAFAGPRIIGQKCAHEMDVQIFFFFIKLIPQPVKDMEQYKMTMVQLQGSGPRDIDPVKSGLQQFAFIAWRRERSQEKLEFLDINAGQAPFECIHAFNADYLVK